MKRLVVVALLAMMSFTAVARDRNDFSFSAVCTTGQTLYYRIISDNEVELTYPGSNETTESWWDGYDKPTGDLTIPATVVDPSDHRIYNVTTIGYCAFRVCRDLTSVTISQGITEIGQSAFDRCTSLSVVNLPNSLRTIGFAAFYASAINTITFPANIESIGESAFGDCNYLTTVYIPASVTSITQNPFKLCDNLTTIIVDDQNPNYESRGCNAIINKSGNCLIIGCRGTDLQGAQVAAIGDYAFNGCVGLTGDLSIPTTVKEIGSYAFEGCTNLNGDLTIHRGVEKIASKAFNNCSFNHIYYHAVDCVVSDLNQSAMSMLQKGAAPLVVNNDEEKGPFTGCSGQLIIGSEVKNIGSYMFNLAAFTGNITIPANVKLLENYTFGNITTIDTVFFNATNCERYMTRGVLSLLQKGEKADRINIASQILNGVFRGCTAELTIGHGVLDIGPYLFENSSFTGELVIPENITKINDGTFKGCDGFTKLTLHNGINYIGDYAFAEFGNEENNNELTLVIPSKLTKINNGAFMGSKFIGALNIPDAVKIIGDNAFRDCAYFSSVNLNSITHLGACAFVNVNMPCVLTIPGTLEYMGRAAFSMDTKEPESLESSDRDGDMAQEMTDYEKGSGRPISIANRWQYNSIPTAQDNVGAFTALVFENDCPLLTEIPDRAFWGQGSFANDWSFPSSLTSIGVCAYAGCTGLQNCMELPESVETIGERAFALCTFSCIDLNQVKEIGSEAFLNCESLTNLTGLTTNHLPSDLEELYGNAFNGTGWYNNYGGADYKGVVYLDKWVLGYKGTPGETENLVIVANHNSKSIKNIATEAFAQNTNFKAGLTLPEGLEVIGRSAFAGCTKMTGILTIPASVTKIGYGAFSATLHKANGESESIIRDPDMGAKGLLQMWFTGLVFAENSNLQTISDYAFEHCRKMEGNLSIPATVTSIGTGAFYYCDKFTSRLILPASLTKIAPSTFSYCTGLTGLLEIPVGVKEIGEKCFFSCSHLEHLSFATSKDGTTGLEKIGNEAFRFCTNIYEDNLIIPDDVTYIGDRAFFNCEHICDFTIGNNVEYIGVDAFAGTCWYDGHDNDGVIYLGNWVIGLKGERANVTILNEIVDGETTTTIKYIAPQAFASKSCITSVVIPSSIISIGDGAFFNCTNLVGTKSAVEEETRPLNIPRSVVTIGNRAFSGCSALCGLVFADNNSSLEVIGNVAFKDCSGITGELNIPEGVEKIGFQAFMNTGVTSITIPESAIDIMCNAFNDTPWYEALDEGFIYEDNCLLGYKGSGGSYENLKIQEGTRVIAGFSFVRLYNGNVFNDITIKGVLTLPNSLIAIGEYAFYYCNGLDGDLIIPKHVTTIGHYAFADCDGFKGNDLILSCDMESIGARAFAGCKFNRIFSPKVIPPTMGVTSSTETITSDKIDENTSVFGDVEKDITIYIPSPLLLPMSYSQAKEWKNYTNQQIAHFFIGEEGQNVSEWNALMLSPRWVASDGAGSNDFAVFLSNCDLPTSRTVRDLYVAQGYTFTIKKATSKDGETSNVLTVTGTLENRGNASNFVIESGAQLINNTDGVLACVEKDIIESSPNNPYWQFIASPMVNELASGLLDGTHNVESVLFTFNQAPAAPDYLEWENFLNDEHTDATIINGQGYLYAQSNFYGPFTFNGKLKPSENDMSVSLDYSNDNPAVEMRGWNLVGNPFPCNAYISRSYYVINADGKTLNETPETDLTNAIAPCTGIFIKAETTGESVSFTRTAPTSESMNLGYLKIGLLSGNVATRSAKTIDHATVSFNAGDELQKLNLLTGDTKIYIPRDGKQYAIAVAEQKGELPLNFEAYENGTYTINITPDRAELSYLHLIDNLTGADVDLLQTSSYSFEASTKDYASRFRLVFSANDENGASIDSETFAYYNGSEWVISNPSTGSGAATLQVIDAMGRVLSNETVNGNASVSLNQTPGVYVLRLINCDSIKTQKIVIR